MMLTQSADSPSRHPLFQRVRSHRLKYQSALTTLVSVLRCVFAGVFPLFGSKLFTKLGIDWGMGLLAFLLLGIGIPFIPLVCRPVSRAPSFPSMLTCQDVHVW